MTSTANRHIRPGGNRQCNRRSYGIVGGKATARSHRNDSRNRTVTETGPVPDFYLLAKASLATELAKAAAPRILAEEVTVIRHAPERTLVSQPVHGAIRYDRTTTTEQDRKDREFVLVLGAFLTAFMLPIWTMAVGITVMVTA